MPLNAEEIPLGCVDVIIYKSIGDVCFEKPQALACLLYEFNGIIDGGILEREGLRWIEAFNAGVRGRQIKKKKKEVYSLCRVFPCGCTYWACGKYQEGRRLKWTITDPLLRAFSKNWKTLFGSFNADCGFFTRYVTVGEERTPKEERPMRR